MTVSERTFQPVQDGADWAVKSMATGFIFGARFPTRQAALAWIERQLEGVEI